MLKRHGQALITLMFVSELGIALASWFIANRIRFGLGIFEVFALPPERYYTVMYFLIAATWTAVSKSSGLYTSQRSTPFSRELMKVVKTSSVFTLVLLACVYFYFGAIYSRLTFVLYLAVNTSLLAANRAAIRRTLKHIRKRGYNLRHVLIIGAGALGRRLAERIEDNHWMGLNVVGYLDDGLQKDWRVRGREVLGAVCDVSAVIKDKGVDQVFIALPASAYQKLAWLLDALARETVDVRVVPDVSKAITLNLNVEELGGIPLINMSESPVQGWLWVLKRVSDVAISLMAIAVTGPLMLAIAAAIKATSKGPVLYRQERMGLNGKTFDMLKFRSMVAGAESGTGAVWAAREDPRRTRFGTFLRKTSLDELPQFFNVLKGEMSVVGPRPERPVFISRFVDEIPGYMLRHKVKAGITGWAQVNGLRGNTSLTKRIEYDLYYIDHWSPWLDMKIMWLTLWKGFINESAY